MATWLWFGCSCIWIGVAYKFTTRGGVEDTRLETKTKNTKKFRGQGPRTQAQRSPKKCLQHFFSGDLHLRKTKKVFAIFSARFLAFSNKISTVQKIVLSSSRRQGNFWGLEALRPRTSKCVLKDVLEAKDVLEDSISVYYSYRLVIINW